MSALISRGRKNGCVLRLCSFRPTRARLGFRSRHWLPFDLHQRFVSTTTMLWPLNVRTRGRSRRTLRQRRASYETVSDEFRSTLRPTTRVSKLVRSIGLPGILSKGSYHGSFSTTPSWTDCASNRPMSSPSSGTKLLSPSDL